MGAVRPRLRCLAYLRGAVLPRPAPERLPRSRLARNGGQLAAVRRAVRDLQLLGDRLLARVRPEIRCSSLRPRRETEIGTDFTLFNRLGVVFTYVDSKTKNQILPAPTPSIYGFSSQWQNAGTLASKTFEAELSLPIVTRRNFSWSMKGTWDKTRTWISELFVPQFFAAAGTAQGTGSFFLFTAERLDLLPTVGGSVGLPAERQRGAQQVRQYLGPGVLQGLRHTAVVGPGAVR